MDVMKQTKRTYVMRVRATIPPDAFSSPMTMHLARARELYSSEFASGISGTYNSFSWNVFLVAMPCAKMAGRCEKKNRIRP